MSATAGVVREKLLQKVKHTAEIRFFFSNSSERSSKKKMQTSSNKLSKRENHLLYPFLPLQGEGKIFIIWVWNQQSGDLWKGLYFLIWFGELKTGWEEKN